MSRLLPLLYDLSRSFSELIDLDELLPTVIAKTKELLHADGSAVLLVDEEKREFFFPYTAEAHEEVDRRLATFRVPLERGIAGWVVQNGVADLVVDASVDPRWNPAVDQETGMETRGLITAPLRTRRGVIGVIQLRSARTGAFSQEDLGSLDALAQSIAIAIENAQRFGLLKRDEQGLRQQVAVLHREVARSSRFADIVGSSPAMQRVFRLVEGALTAPVTVLLLGETGTGKDLLARAIHFNGPRQGKPYVAVNCGALSEHLLESELFGHRRGAFTGASEDRKGLFEVANGGTIFLDEVTEMSPAMQVKLLRVLQNGEVLPVGENVPRKVDVRVVAASNSDVESDLASGRFRRDLFYRLSSFPVPVPPLRERVEDIPLLVAHFLQEICQHFDKSVAGVSRAGLEIFCRYPWPGNVRELHNEIERAVVLTRMDASITPNEISPHIANAEGSREETAEPSPVAGDPPSADGADGDPFASLREARAAFEAGYIARVLAHHDGNVSATARTLGIARSILREKIKAYGLR